MRPSWLLALAGLTACAELAPRPAGECGNAVLEDGEDCDVAGGPGTAACVQCRLVCANDDACPAGWGCGDDGLCRHGTGRWHEVGTPLLEAAWDIELADVDGDGRLDVFGYSPSRVWARLGQPGGGFGGGLTVPSTLAYGAPVFGNLDTDGFVDVIAAGPRSLVLGYGHEPVIGFAVAPQPGFTVMIEQLVSKPIRTDNAPFQDLALVSLTPQSTLTATILRLGVAPAPPTVLAPLAASLGYQVLDLDDDDRDELVVATGETTVTVFDVVDDALGRPVPVPRAVIDFGFSVWRSFFVADVTGDGVRDLIVTLGDVAAVAAGDGAGGLLPPALDPSLGASGDLLALADLDGDGDPDVVGSAGLALRDAGASVVVAASVAPWFDAVVTDVNYDGLPDVAAYSTFAGVELLLGAPGGTLYSRSFLLTDRTVNLLRAGDYDGDRFADLALVVGTPFEPNEAMVLFGGPAGLTDDTLTLGRFDQVHSLETADFRIGDDPLTLDATADLLLQTTTAAAPTLHQIMTFIGNADRFPVAPYDVERDPASVLIGRFEPGGAQQGDIIVLYQDGGAALVLGNGAEPLRPEDRHALALVGVEPWCVLDPYVAGAAVADLDGDGRDEIVGVVCDPSGYRVQVARVSGTAAAPVLTAVDVVTPPGAFTGLRATKLHDLDGDGALDLLLSFTGWAAPDSSSLVVHWGQAGTIGPESTVLAAAGLAPGFGSFAPLEADGDPGREILMSTGPAGPGLLRIDVDGRQLAAVPTAVLATGVPRGGDVDGDGVDDLVVVAPEGLRVFLACAHDDSTLACR